MLSVSVVIPTLNRQGVVRHTVLMLAEQDYEEYEVLVVDQTLDRDLELEALMDQLGEKFSYCRVSEPNLPAARNLGIRKTVGELILFIDDDVELDSDFVSLHVRAHAENDGIGAATGLVIDTDKPVEQSLEWCRKAFSVPEVESGRTFDVSWAFGGNTSYRRAVLLDSGLFDENFRGCAIGEDNDLSERVRNLGHRIILDTRIQMRHLNLKRGGCDVRNPDEEDRVRAEQFELNMYRMIKRFVMQPSFESVRGAYISLRYFMISRSLIRQGPSAILRRQLQVVCGLSRVFRALVRSSPQILWTRSKL